MHAIVFFAFTSAGTVLGMAAYGAENDKFAVYYSDRAPPERFNSYQLLVLDRIHHPPLSSLTENGKTLLGYISLGEIEETSPYFSTLKANGLVLQENKNWKGSYFIDIRKPLWQKIVIEEIIPRVLQDGFDGVFFDTLDSPLELERKNPGKYAGMSDAAVHFIEGVRMHYPSIKIMLNRSYAILPRVAPDIDMALGESIIGEYDFNKKAYVRVKESLYLEQVQRLQDAKRSNPALKIYTLDYADTNDHKAIADIYRLERANGFTPYVASVGLDELVDEPNL